MIMTGENKCFICGENIHWYFNLSNGNSIECFTIPNGRVIGTPVAIAKVLTSEGSKPQFEVTVACPRCNNKNKF